MMENLDCQKPTAAESLSFPSDSFRASRALVFLGLFLALSLPLAAETSSPHFAVEVHPLDYGAELIVFKVLPQSKGDEEIPLMALLNDTLEVENPYDDKFRYLWIFTYTRPRWWQRVLAAVPFFYHSVGNRKCQSCGPPPPLIDLSSPRAEGHEKMARLLIQNMLLDPSSWVFSVTSRSYFKNTSRYKKSQVAKALFILSSYYKSPSRDPREPLDDEELKRIYAQLSNQGDILGTLLDEKYLLDLYSARFARSQKRMAANRELLRQRAEEEGLFFQPLSLPNGLCTHALLWVSRQALQKRWGEPFDKRFLNIANPWKDRKLVDWQGYSKIFYLDAEQRPVGPEHPSAQPVEMIPLALYGLDFEKIPTLLVDFRDIFNPKLREISGTALEDGMRYLFGLSAYRDLGYFVGRKLVNRFTRGTGKDLNQPSRLNPYAQLKVLQMLSSLFDEELQKIISRDVEKLNINPLENDLEAETELCHRQYEALLQFALEEDGLRERVQKDREKEKRRLRHGAPARTFLKLAQLASFGLYRHRERPTPELERLYQTAREMEYHRRLLREVSETPTPIEVAWDPERIHHSLEFLSQLEGQDEKMLALVRNIYEKSEDPRIRQLCLNWFQKVRPEMYAQLKSLESVHEPVNKGGDF